MFYNQNIWTQYLMFIIFCAFPTNPKHSTGVWGSVCMWVCELQSIPRNAEGDTVPLLRETMTLIPVSMKGTEKSMTSDLSSLMVREPTAMWAFLNTTCRAGEDNRGWARGRDIKVTKGWSSYDTHDYSNEWNPRQKGEQERESTRLRNEFKGEFHHFFKMSAWLSS